MKPNKITTKKIHNNFIGETTFNNNISVKIETKAKTEQEALNKLLLLFKIKQPIKFISQQNGIKTYTF